MTMQFGLRAAGGALVLASDTKVRSTEKVMTASDRYIPDGVVSQPKIRISQRHELAVALAGGVSFTDDPAQELADYLSEQKIIPDVIGPLLIEWGNVHFQRKRPGQKPEFPLYTLLVVNPRTRFCPFWRVRVNHQSTDQASNTFIVNGQDTNPAIFWPQFFKCDKEVYDLTAASHIAALSILMGAELNPYGVSGLEIWHYMEAWKPLSRLEIEAEILRFGELKTTLDRMIRQ